MIPAAAAPELGTFHVVHEGPFQAGLRTTLLLEFLVGPAGLPVGARVRVGLPNTGWEEPVPPQQRYWDELNSGASRRLAPFHPVNTTAGVFTRDGEARPAPVVALAVMERMLTPDEDPALAYWRWWITATVEEAPLQAGDVLRIVYGDRRFGADGARLQTFTEDQINVCAYVQREPSAPYQMAAGSPFYLDVVSGPSSRANAVAPSVHEGETVPVRVSVTDACQCLPPSQSTARLDMAAQTFDCVPGRASEIHVGTSSLSQSRQVRQAGTGAEWGRVNPTTSPGPDGLRLFWGDLHAQSEHHVMHSQKNDFRQTGWSKGISSGTVDDCYRYAREVAMLDFVALTDQGACLTHAWEFCQGKVREYHEPGRFVTFKAYEAGAPIGHRNVIYRTDDIEPPLDAKKFSNFHPAVLYDYYRERKDAILIPHHVKTWTDWNYHDPELEPVMEIYSCWGQSEAPGLDLWNKGMTPGAGAWNAFARGYRMGLMASSDNHVGMPGRSHYGDRQAHTPFKAGLCAVWAADLQRDTILDAIQQRRCYGTTGSRIIVRFSLNGQPMGSAIRPAGPTVQASVEVFGTDELTKVELATAGESKLVLPLDRGTDRMQITTDVPAPPAGGHYYLRVYQADGERAWSSPVFVD